MFATRTTQPATLAAVLLLAGYASAGMEGYSSAYQLRDEVEALTVKHVKTVEAYFARDPASRPTCALESAGVSTATHHRSCDAPWAGWGDSGFQRRSPSVNWVSQTCTRIDTNAYGVDALPESISGRDNNGKCDCDVDSICKQAETYGAGADADCQNVDFWVTKAQGRTQFYNDQKGCTEANEPGKCTANSKWFGYNTPDNVQKYDVVGGIERFNEEMCALEQVLPQWQEEASNDKVAGWMFQGFHKTGLYANWPMIYQCRTENQCTGCSDPRYRSWYANAAGGPKDIVILLDTSGSMSGARLAAMKESMEWVLSTFGETDYATVVQYNSVASACTNTLIQMTSKNKAKLLQYVQALNAGGGTNMNDGMKRAFEVFQATTKSSGCMKLLLFLTDGANSQSDDELHKLVASKNADVDARIFTFTFGSSGGLPTMTKIACDNRGVARFIPDGGDLKEAMASYYMYLAAGIQPKTSTCPSISWVELFEDGQGTGPLTAACAPAFTKDDPPDLIGVFCSGVSVGFTSELDGWQPVWNAMQESNRKCRDTQLSSKQLATLRVRMGAEECPAVSSSSSSSSGNAPPLAATFNPTTSFDNAAGMRAAIEAEIIAVGKEIEAAVTTNENPPTVATERIVRSCSPDPDLLGEHGHSAGSGYLNAVTDSCTRIDLDETGAPKDDGDASVFRTGRFLQDAVRGAGELPDMCMCEGQCGAAARAATNVKANIMSAEWVDDVLNWLQGDYSKNNALVNQQCIHEPVGYIDDPSECSYFPENVGFNAPDGEDAIFETERGRVQAAAMQNLVPRFKDFADKHPDVSWTYGGFQENGLYTNYPMIDQCRTENQCDGCSDPRFRGWYADAATGPKDVVLVIDDSASSVEEMALIVDAAVWALNTLSATDFGGMVTTSGQTVPLSTMSGSNKAQLRTFIETSLRGRGAPSSDVVSAFTAAFELWNGVTGSGCSKNILYVSSGPHSGNAATAAQQITARNGKINGGPANIFAYEMSPGTVIDDNNLPHMLACQNDGVWYEPEGATSWSAISLKQKLAGYYEVLATFMVPKPTSCSPISWSEMYEDGQGIGPTTSACTPTYDRTTNPPSLLGVFCIGYSVPHLMSLDGWQDEWEKIRASNQHCHSVALTGSQLECLRYRKNARSTCSVASETSNPCDNVGSWWGDYKEDTLSCDTPLEWGQGIQLKHDYGDGGDGGDDDDDNFCASGGLSTGAIVGVVVASVVAVVFISLAVACCITSNDQAYEPAQRRAGRRQRNGQPPPPPAARSPWEASRQYGHGAKEVLEAEQGHEAERRPPTYRDMMSEKPARQVSEV